MLEYGSAESRRPSPTKVNASMTAAMHAAGSMTGHGEVEKTWKPSLIMTPQVGVGGLIPVDTPKPRPVLIERDQWLRLLPVDSQPLAYDLLAIVTPLYEGAATTAT